MNSLQRQFVRQQPPTSGTQTRGMERAGFTLVEMLVSTALVMLIMSLFAQIYGTAIGTMTEQRGMANNDQKARILSSILRSDLQNMTYRQVSYPYGNVQGIVPMAAGDEPIIDPINQRGYFYFSENNPNIDWDDVLQFTTMIRTGQRGDAPIHNQQRPYVGKASTTALSTPVGTAGTNQPMWDDGNSSSGQGRSRAAEICYFLRNGNLYRRTFLLRDPLPAPVAPDNQPTTSNGTRIYNGTNGPSYTGSNTFYNDFDYSATRASDSTGNNYLWFHSVNSLQNNLGRTNLPIALSYTRFGFSPVTGTTFGKPIEYGGDDNVFFGRFTAQETSSSNFGFPGNTTTVPFTNPGQDDDGDGALDNYQGNDRIGEDILLTNVETFDVELLDPGTGSFVSIAATAPVAASTFASSQNSGYQSIGGSSNIYDTWHPSMTSELNIGTPPYNPPFRSLLSPSGTNWLAESSVAIGSVYLPLAGEDQNLNRALDSGEDINGNSVLDIPGAWPNGSLRAIVVQAGTTGKKMPEWPRSPGSFATDGTAVWQIQDNRIGLRAIRITIRYRDVSSNLSRQVTLVHSFVE